MALQRSDSPQRSNQETAAEGNNPSPSQIPASLEPLLQEYDLDSLDLERHAVSIIERTLEHGSQAEVRWLFSTYAVGRVRDVVRSRGARQLSPRAFAFWRLVLGIETWQPHPWPAAARALWNPSG